MYQNGQGCPWFQAEMRFAKCKSHRLKCARMYILSVPVGVFCTLFVSTLSHCKFITSFSNLGIALLLYHSKRDLTKKMMLILYTITVWESLIMDSLSDVKYRMLRMVIGSLGMRVRAKVSQV